MAIRVLILVVLVAVQLVIAEPERVTRSRYTDTDEDADGRSNKTATQPPSLLPLHFQFFSTVDDPNSGLRYSETSIPALKLAVDHINANTSLLSRYHLTYDVKVLECSRTAAVDLFFQDVFSHNSVIAFLGSACPQAVTPIAKLVHRWNITQIVSSPLEMVTSKGYSVSSPNLLRLYPIDSAIVPALLSLSTHYQWKRLLVISSTDDTFLSVMKKINQLFPQNNVSVAHRQLQADSTILSVPDLMGEADDYRIIFLNVNPREAGIILCEAYHRGHVYPYYTWILYGWYENGWWKNSKLSNTDFDENCSEESMLSILEHSLFLRVYPRQEDKELLTETGINYNQFKNEWIQLLNSTDEMELSSFHAPLTYDAVWTLAMALHRVDTGQSDSDVVTNDCGEPSSSGLNSLAEFNYSNSYLSCWIRHELLKTNFIGVSGLVAFANNGTRIISDVSILQYRTSKFDKLKVVEFAKYNLHTEELVYSPGESIATVFPGGVTPDGTPRNETVTFLIPLTATYYTITTIGIVFGFICLGFNIKYRKERVVKLTSPTINYILIVGALMMFSSVYIRLLPHPGETVNTIRCNVQISVNVVAFCLGFGAVLTKLGRVHQIFNNPSPKKKKICMKDWHMVLFVFSVTGIGILLVIIMVGFFRAKATLVQSEEYEPGKDNLGVTINYYAYQCFSEEKNAPFYYIHFLHGYLFIFQIVSLVFAIKTRKIKVSALNDSKYIYAIVYVSSLVVAMILIINFTSDKFQNIHEGFVSAGIFIATFSLLGFTFIPKMVIYYRDPRGEHLLKDLSGPQPKEPAITPNQEKITTLEKRVSDLKNQINRYKSEIITIDVGDVVTSSTTVFCNGHIGSIGVNHEAEITNGYQRRSSDCVNVESSNNSGPYHRNTPHND